MGVPLHYPAAVRRALEQLLRSLEPCAPEPYALAVYGSLARRTLREGESDVNDLIHGTEPFSELEVKWADMRVRAEQELRNHLLRLRRGWLFADCDVRALAPSLFQSAKSRETGYSSASGHSLVTCSKGTLRRRDSIPALCAHCSGALRQTRACGKGASDEPRAGSRG